MIDFDILLKLIAAQKILQFFSLYPQNEFLRSILFCFLSNPVKTCHSGFPDEHKDRNLSDLIFHAENDLLDARPIVRHMYSHISLLIQQGNSNIPHR